MHISYNERILHTLLYKVPSNSTGKNIVTKGYKCVLRLPVEFITKYFKDVFDP